jgi:hypothetical protein
VSPTTFCHSPCEVLFTYSASRAHATVERIIRNTFNGTIVSDGYAAYARYAEKNDRVTHSMLDSRQKAVN